jgi:hypothetical protein
VIVDDAFLEAPDLFTLHHLRQVVRQLHRHILERLALGVRVAGMEWTDCHTGVILNQYSMAALRMTILNNIVVFPEI